MAVNREWAFLRSVLWRTYNQEVQNYFRDIDDEELEDINAPRKALKRACWLRKNETQQMAILKRDFFRYDIQRAADRVVVIGQTKGEVDQLFKYKPTVHFYFKQDPEAVPEGFEPIEYRPKIRLVDQESSTITEAYEKTLANKIKQELGLNGGFTVNKSKNKYTYKSEEHGLDNSINSSSDTEAASLFRKLCAIAGAQYDEEKLGEHPSKKASVNNPGTVTILGRTVKKPRYRPSGVVRFRYAYLNLHGLNNPRYLVDLTGRYPNAHVLF